MTIHTDVLGTTRPEHSESEDVMAAAVRRLAHSIREAGAIVGVSERTVWREISRGRIAAIKVGGRTMISDDELRLYVRRQEDESRRLRDDLASKNDDDEGDN